MERAKPIYRAIFTIRKGIIDNREKLLAKVKREIQDGFAEIGKNSGYICKMRATENGGTSYDYYHKISGFWYGSITIETTPKGNSTKVIVCGFWYQQLPYLKFAEKIEERAYI